MPMLIASWLCQHVISQGGNIRNTIWQSAIALGVYYTIQIANGAGLIHGLLLGALVQALNVGYGIVTHQWGFTLSVLGLMAFVEVWLPKWKTARTKAGHPGAESATSK